MNKMDTWLQNLNPWRKRVGGRENKGNLGQMEWIPMRKLRNDLGDVEMIGSTWKEAHRLERIDMTISMIKRVSIHIAIWEHHLEKVWNQHLTSKQLEYHNSKQNKGLACRISRNKHMIEISSEVFVVGPTRARMYSTIMYKAVHMTYEVSPNQHSQGFFMRQRDHYKTNRG